MMPDEPAIMSRPPAEPDTTRSRRYGGLSADERRALRRERLLAAAFDAFGSRGYASTTIEGLCADAGVTARHFYEEFDGRESLLRATSDRIVDRVNDAIRDAIAEPSGSPEVRIGRAVRAFLEAVLVDPRNARILCVESVGVSPELEQRRREVLRGFATTVSRAVRIVRPDLADDDPVIDTASMLIVGGANEVVVDWLHREERRDLDAIARDFVSLFTAMIRGFASE